MNTLTTIVTVQDKLDYTERLRDIDDLIQRVQSGKNITQDVFRKHIFEVIKTLEYAVNTLDFLDTSDIEEKTSILYTLFENLKTYHQQHVQLRWNIRKFYKDSMHTLEQFHTEQYQLLEQLKNNNNEFQLQIEQLGFGLIENAETYTNYINHNQDELVKLQKSHQLFYTKLNSFKEGLQKRIPLAKKRLLDYAASTAIYVDDYKQKVSDSVHEFVNIMHWTNEFLESEKQFKTHSLLKERSKESGSLFVFTSEEEYYEYMLKWNNEWGVEKLLGIVGNVTSFKYPTAYFDPNSGEVIRSLVSGDPFYVVDDKTYPYIKLLENIHQASHRKLLLYSKKKAQTEMVPGSVGLCVSWNNFPFYTHGQITKDLSLMSSLLRPGGYAVFNYADAHSVAGAHFIEENRMPLIWRERMERIASDHGLELVMRYDDNLKMYPFAICLFQKVGETEDLNLVNKVGLVLPDLNFLKKKG